MIRRSRKISISTREVCIISKRKCFLRAYCKECGSEMGMVSVSDAAILVSKSHEEIGSMVDSGKVHRLDGKEDNTYVCLNSLYMFEEGNRVIS